MLNNLGLQFFISLVFCNLFALGLGTIAIIILKHFSEKGVNVSLAVSYPMFLLMSCYFASVAAITVIPLPIFAQYPKTAYVNLVPLAHTFRDLLDSIRHQNSLLANDVLRYIVGNFVIFVPFGIFLPLAFKKLATYKRVFISAVVGSVLIEIAQFFSRYINNYRQADIDDVILNSLGALAGFFLYRVWMEGGRKKSVATGTLREAA